MRCYRVLVHGRLNWHDVHGEGDGDVSRPAGFFCHRYVLAASEAVAAEKAIHRVRATLDTWLGARRATVVLDPEEIGKAPIYKLLIPENRGHTFYAEE